MSAWLPITASTPRHKPILLARLNAKGEAGSGQSGPFVMSYSPDRNQWEVPDRSVTWCIDGPTHWRRNPAEIWERRARMLRNK